MTYQRGNGKSEKSLIEFIEWLDSLEETPVDYVEVAKLLWENRKKCAELPKTFWIVSEKGAEKKMTETNIIAIAIILMAIIVCFCIVNIFN